MIQKSDNGQGYTIICDLCGLVTETHLKVFRDVVIKIAQHGGSVRQEARRTGSGYGPPFWRNYCNACTPIEGILID